MSYCLLEQPSRRLELNRLRAVGYRFALDDFIFSASTEPFLEFADFIKVDLRQVDGIGDRTAERLSDAGIHNLRDLAASSPQAVADALKATPINPPTVERSQHYIDDAKATLEKLKNPPKV